MYLSPWLPQGHSRLPAVRDEAIVQFHVPGFISPIHEMHPVTWQGEAIEGVHPTVV